MKELTFDELYEIQFGMRMNVLYLEERIRAYRDDPEKKAFYEERLKASESVTSKVNKFLPF